MKLPYRAGDSFALPLGDGSAADAQIVACGHHTVDVVVRGGDGETLPAMRASDRALVLQRWRRTGTHAITDAGAPAGTYWVGPARFERIAATRLGVALLEWMPLAVHEGRFTPHYACARNESELRALATRGVNSLIVAGNVELANLAAMFDGLRHLRIAARGTSVDARNLARCSSLATLDVSGVPVSHVEALAELDSLRALRFARVNRFDLHALREVRSASLAFETIADLRHLHALTNRSDLAQLELLDLWPCALEDVMPLVELPQLVRAYVDIGGRRKNVELNRRARWAYPWPPELSA